MMVSTYVCREDQRAGLFRGGVVLFLGVKEGRKTKRDDARLLWAGLAIVWLKESSERMVWVLSSRVAGWVATWLPG